MNEINRETLIEMGVLDPKAREFDADSVRKEVAIRDENAVAALNLYRAEKGIAAK